MIQGNKRYITRHGIGIGPGADANEHQNCKDSSSGVNLSAKIQGKAKYGISSGANAHQKFKDFSSGATAQQKYKDSSSGANAHQKCKDSSSGANASAMIQGKAIYGKSSGAVAQRKC